MNTGAWSQEAEASRDTRTRGVILTARSVKYRFRSSSVTLHALIAYIMMFDINWSRSHARLQGFAPAVSI